jgi:hypothetical protein
MRASFGLMCIAACGVAAGALLWCDRDLAGQPAVAPAREHSQARPAEPEQPAFAARTPRPSLDSHVTAPTPAHVDDSRPGHAGARGPGHAPDTQLPDSDDIAVTRALVRASLERDIPRKLPQLELSAQALDRLSDTVLRVREHQTRLRGLAHTRDNAIEIQRLEAELVHDLQVFEEVTGMSATELTGALSDEGLTTEEQAHAEKPVYWTLPE